MLCAKCKERKATVHLTEVDGDKLRKMDFCEECAEPFIESDPRFQMHELAEFMKSEDMQERAAEYIAGVFSFPPEAYKFVKEALNESQRQAGLRNMSGRQLCHGARELALRKFGKQAKRALAELKIFKTEDIGKIVYELVEAGILTKQPEDSLEDFSEGFDFDEAFPEK